MIQGRLRTVKYAATPAVGLFQEVIERLGDQPAGLPNPFGDIDNGEKHHESAHLPAGPFRTRKRRKTLRRTLLMRLSDGDNDLDLYRYAAGQRAHADGRTRVPAALAEDFDKEVGAAIHDF